MDSLWRGECVCEINMRLVASLTFPVYSPVVKVASQLWAELCPDLQAALRRAAREEQSDVTGVGLLPTFLGSSRL